MVTEMTTRYYTLTLRNGLKVNCRYIGESFLYHSLKANFSGKWYHVRKSTFASRTVVCAAPIVASPAKGRS